jgi:hypothetical protein
MAIIKKTSGSGVTQSSGSKVSFQGSRDHIGASSSEQTQQFPDKIILEDYEEVLGNLSTKVDTLRGEIKVLKKEQKDQLKEIHDGKDRVIETLAIFVALFTFISINFNFFSNKCLTPLVFIGINLTLGGFLLIFVSLVRVRGSISRKNLFEISLCIISFFLIAGGSVLVTLRSEDYGRCQIYSESSNREVNQPKFESVFTDTSESSTSATSK